MADAAAVDALVARTVERFGRLDVLVNSAATDHPASVEDLTHEQWRRVVAVNLNGPFYAAKAAFPVMRRQGGGLIINVSSVAGRKGWANATACCATEFALTGLTQALNAEGAPFGIRCAVVYHGGMDTGWHREGHPEFLEPETVARFLLHMASQVPRLVVNEAVVTPVGEAGYP